MQSLLFPKVPCSWESCIPQFIFLLFFWSHWTFIRCKYIFRNLTTVQKKSLVVYCSVLFGFVFPKESDVGESYATNHSQCQGGNWRTIWPTCVLVMLGSNAELETTYGNMFGQPLSEPRNLVIMCREFLEYEHQGGCCKSVCVCNVHLLNIKWTSDVRVHRKVFSFNIGLLAKCQLNHQGPQQNKVFWIQVLQVHVMYALCLNGKNIDG